MKIRWFGHACFGIVSANGTRIITDPFDESVGYPMPDAEADIVTTSHGHFDHNHTKGIKGNFRHLHKPGEYNVSGIGIKGIPTFHDDSKGTKRGANVVFVFRVDGLTVCHCGDLGHDFSREQAEELSDIDILIIPVGGTYTIDARTAAKIVKTLNPRVTIPMHYKTEAINFPITGVENFLELVDGCGTERIKELDVDKDSIGKLPKVLVMDY
jgi:L-ascorbate metabolism protein UlaG (beta-lactamase superfamily)